MSPCRVTTDFFENCGHIITTTVCSDTSIAASLPRAGRCTPDCSHDIRVPDYHYRKTCPFCLALPGKPNLPATAIRSDDCVVLPVSKVETRRWRFQRHAVAIQQARQREYDAWKCAREKKKAEWEALVAAERALEEENNVELSQRIFYENYDDGRLFQDVNDAAVTQHSVCAICILPHDNGTKRLPCGHIFHRECVEKWFYEVGQKSCPLCRQVYIIKKVPCFD